MLLRINYQGRLRLMLWVIAERKVVQRRRERRLLGKALDMKLARVRKRLELLKICQVVVDGMLQVAVVAQVNHRCCNRLVP